MNKLLFGAALILVGTAAVVIKPVEITGSSMEPALSDGEICVCLRKVPYRRGDIVCVRVCGRLIVKRVTALPGDVTPFGVVPEKMLYLTGDNRAVSIDSSSGLGFIPKNCYVGKIVSR